MPARDGGSSNDRGDSQGGRASWRSGGKAAGGQKYRWQHDWARKGEQQHRGRVLGRRLKIAGWSLLALGLIAAVIVIALFFPKRTPLVAQAIVDYPAPLPPNAWARDDLDALAALHDRSLNVDDISAAWTSKEHGLERLKSSLAAAVPGGPARQVLKNGTGAVIIYVSMHGVADAANVPCLVCPGAAPLASDTWLPLTELLRAIKEQPKLAKAKKLVVLDASRIDANWSLGVLYNALVDGLQQAVDDAEDPNLVVLSSASPGQIGWCSEPMGGSVFGRFFERGLRGEADREGQGNDDGRVSLAELHRYVQHHVRQWSLANRFDVQEPMLFTPGAEAVDFDVAWSLADSRGLAHRFVSLFTGGKAPAPEAPAETTNAADLVTDAWKRHGELLNSAPERDEPLLWQNFEHKLLRLEQLLAGGKAYQREAVDLRSEVDRLATLLERGRRPDGLAVHSLPMLSFVGASGVSEGDRAKMLAALANPKAPLPPDVNWSYAQRASVAAAWMLENPAQSNLRQALEFAGRADPPGGVIELHFARMLDRYLDPESWKSTSPIGRAMRLRTLAEQTAAPLDARVVYALQTGVEQADAARRAAEDELFIASADALDRFGQRAADAEQTYRQSLAETKELVEAWQWVDRAQAQLPYLAAWSLRRPAPGATASNERIGAKAIAQLAQDTAALRDMLDAATTRRPVFDDVVKLRAAVADGFSVLRKSYDDQCERLRFESGVDQRTARDLIDLLAIPLVSGDVRNELRTTLAHIDRELHKRYRQIEGSGGSEAADGEAKASIWLERLTAAPRHPALAMLAAAPSRGEEPATVDDLQRVRTLSTAGGRVRELLAAVTAEVRKALNPAEADESTIRARINRGDRAARRSAALSYELDGVDDSRDPTYQLRMCDLHHLLLWQARRSADDFWGPSEQGQRSFFILAADDYCVGAERAFAVGQADSDAARAYVAQRREAEDQGLHPACKPETLLVVDANQLLNEAVTARAPAQMPAGAAALWLRDSSGQGLSLLPADGDASTPLRRLPLVFDPQGKERGEARASYSVPGEQLANRGSAMQLVALFRGHEFVTSVPVVESQRGLTEIFARTEALDPRITAIGQAKQRGSITFIFDCSGSMSEQGAPGRSRLDVARTALQAILDDLASGGTNRVAVRVYGHRVRWKDSTGRETLLTPYGLAEQKEALENGQPFSVHPSSDVELILPMSQFGRGEDQKVSDVLNQLEPAGETPLYLAVIQAVEQDFRNEAAAAQRRIIVITDGVNQQSGGGPGVVKTMQNVLDAFAARRQQPIRLDIVGFSIADRQQQELRTIAQQTDGAFYPADNPATLLKALQDSLGLSKYVVTSAQGDAIGEPRELGATFDVPPPRRGPQSYIASLVGAAPPVESEPMVIEANEALRLYLSADRRRFEMRRYDEALRDSATNRPDPLDPGRQFFFGAHVPEWQAGALRLPISIQNADETRFCPRPTEAWIEIKPIAIGRPDEFPSYTFCELNYEPHRPVPVLSCLASYWPTKAEKAEIRIWAKYGTTEPDQVLKLSDAIRPGAATGLRLRTLPDVVLKIERHRGTRAADEDQVVVTQQYPANTARIPGLKVELDPPPRRVGHTYYPEGALVRSVFSFAPGDLEDPSQVRVRFTTRERRIEQAVTVTKPLTVTVPEQLLRN